MVWIIVGLGLCLLEIFTPGFFVLLFGVSALLTGVVSLLGLSSLLWQWVIFLCLSLFFVFFVRKFIVRLLNQQPTRWSNVQSLIGKNAIVTVAIEKSSLKGRVKVEGEEWMAITEEGEVFAPGDLVTVMNISGTKLTVGKGS